MTRRFFNDTVIAVFLAAACALTAYVFTTGAPHGVSGRVAVGEPAERALDPAAQRLLPAGSEGVGVSTFAPALLLVRRPAPTTVNVAYHRPASVVCTGKGLRQRTRCLVTSPPSRALHSVAYWRYWAKTNGHQRRLEHAHVQRLLQQLRVRHVQAHAERGGRPDAVAVGTNSPGITASSLSVTYWRAKQIAAAETIGHEAGADPWPNCPDPIWDGAASWDVTVACENNGSWLDSPGYFRCGLQFEPAWEQRFGRLCP